MTLHPSTLFALLGVALLAVALFSPRRRMSSGAVSFAPPLAVRPDAYGGFVADRPREDDPLGAVWGELARIADVAPPRAPDTRPASCDAPQPFEDRAANEVNWPLLVDPRAAHCDAATRLDVAMALSEMSGEWARAIVRHALADERDDGVLEALYRAPMTDDGGEPGNGSG